MMRRAISCCLWIICLLNVWGCANTQPTHFYLLRAVEASESSTMLGSSKNAGVSLGLGPIQVPKYLERPQIVTRVRSHEIDLAEFHKWAEPLKANLTSVLRENLSALLSTEKIIPYPWNRSTQPTYQLSLNIIQFDGRKNQEAVLRVQWKVVGEDGKTVLQQKTSQFSEMVGGSDYEGLVEAMSRMVASFSREIADAINAQRPVKS